MGVTALVMAGGKGTRMTLGEEKPMLKVGCKPMIGYILSALEDSRMVDEIVVAVSTYTPRTAKFSRGFPVKVIETPGEGYVSDMQYVVRNLRLGTVLVISADLPLVTGEIVDKIVERHGYCKKPALTVVVPIETRDRLGLGRDYVIEVGTKYLVPAGINVIDGGRIDEEKLEEEIFVIDEEEIAVNVNTPQELGIAERLFTIRSCGGTSHFTQC